MTAFQVFLLVFGFISMVMVRVPVAIAIGLILIIYNKILGLEVFEMALDTFQSIDSFPLLAIPMFVLAGTIMATGGVAQRILDLADEFFGHLYGGLAIVTIMTSVIFGGLSGSAPATVAAVGSITIPAMLKQGYNAGFAAGVAACSGVIAIIIPPSNPMIIYSLTQYATSVSNMFLAGIVPGLLLALGMAIPAWYISKLNGWGAHRAKGTLQSRLAAFKHARWAILTPVIILGGIYSGIFTPTESAAVACFYSYIVGVFIHKDLKIKDTFKVLSNAAMITVVAMFLMTFATAFGKVLTSQDVPAIIAGMMADNVSTMIMTLLMINLFLLFVGCFMDTLAAIIILTPLLYPLLAQFGMGVYQFGIMMIINLGIGFVTPPFGGNLFIANQLSDTSVPEVFRGAIPLVLGMMVALLAITFVPFISTMWL
ncbi:TRAP transporter large permease [Thaumasiovibrio sp. DFM-14]|uniref:TRAP transporter large permease n=1 Tax=Thaumasiovibrio sp. DFM-14 TaxID=3384792 RepID=UPI0039A2A17A